MLSIVLVMLAADGGATPLNTNVLNCRVTQEGLADGGASFVVTVLPLPVDAARASRQPDLGAPGRPSFDVLSVQGVPFGRPLRVEVPVPVQVFGIVSLDDAGVPLNINPPASLPLPTGAATAARQDTGNTSLSNIDGKLPALISSRVPVDPSGVTSPVSATSLPLPTGASTAARQDTGNTSLSNIDGKLPALVSSRVPVDLSALPPGGNNIGFVNIEDVPAGAPLADGTVNPSTIPIQQFTMWFNGSTWDRAAGSSASGLSVSIVDGGVEALGRRPDGTLRAIAVDQSGVQFVTVVGGARPSSGNPLLQPCNSVRRSNCR